MLHRRRQVRALGVSQLSTAEVQMSPPVRLLISDQLDVMSPHWRN